MALIKLGEEKMIWLKKLFLEEYEVRIWYDDPKKVTLYRMKTINKLNPKTLVGKDVDGLKVELNVQAPFNYEVKKIL